MASVVRKLLKPLYWRARCLALRRRFRVPGPRIVYALTPPPKLSNVGDQAQAVAIRAWLEHHAPGRPVVEIDKDEVLNCLPRFRRLVGKADVIVLHSGGNLGDRAPWSEGTRRMMIDGFPCNRIVSLPQTIHFSNTATGRAERATTERIYNAHRHLTIMARDRQSHRLAEEMFPDCRLDAAPDFVLGYDWPAPEPGQRTNGRVLLCLRDDPESALAPPDRQALTAAAGPAHDLYDTTLPAPIPKARRQAVLDDTLRMFAPYDAVVTDRFHGLIFAVLTRRPVVVLPTVDHKLTSAFDWFEDVRFARLAPTIDAVPAALAAVRAEPDRSVPDWSTRHFDRLAGYLDG